ncbi:PEP-CTERM sorting domain-containing protein [Haloferula sp.]|uniref:PEP-CTERM sorting domain-containing protein n=1 Tax=Haloferula sp. TaxID=2497595 RepID=UPI003C720E05
MNAGVFVIEPSSYLDFSGTIAGVPWTPQDPGGQSFRSKVVGDIVGTWSGEDFVIGSNSFLELLGVWAGGVYPASSAVPGAIGGIFNYAGEVDLGPGGVIASTTYDMVFEVFGGSLSTLTEGSNLEVFVSSGVSNYAPPGAPGAQSTSLAGGVPTTVTNGALARTTFPDGERIAFEVDIYFEGVTNFGGGQVPFTLNYTGEVSALQGVPEPGVWSLMGLGAVVFLLRRGRWVARASG